MTSATPAMKIRVSYGSSGKIMMARGDSHSFWYWDTVPDASQVPSYSGLGPSWTMRPGWVDPVA